MTLTNYGQGWSAGGFLTNVSLAQDLLVVNMPNGAHHSDLSHSDPGPNDTEDIQEGHEKIAALIGEWLIEIMEE